MAEKLPILMIPSLLSITILSIDNIHIYASTPSSPSTPVIVSPVVTNDSANVQNPPLLQSEQPPPDSDTGDKNVDKEISTNLSSYIKEKFPNSSDYNRRFYLIKSIQFGKNISELGIDNCTQTLGKSRQACSEENKSFKLDIVTAIYEIWKKEKEITDRRRYNGHLFSVNIVGHSSEDGDEETNNKISKERSNNVRKEIIRKIQDMRDNNFSNWAEKRITSSGKGSSHPKYIDKSATYDEVMSRRVEILIEVNEMP